ncbi:MAG: SPFH domain-containing protein [Desulfobacter sp.]|uniref:SPFH domain-containing protein n=1 Tax=uncultured Desulfobacter sp. TaxID=240139 RepID=UPI0029C8373B|nr:SPFH domain-containing protein [uncultured Desulfobacter sp.]MCW8799646.1 SPFH domain-containing protein [Desulfobacter sp.]
MGTDNLIFLEILEWFDETGQELVHRLPEKGSGEIKFGAQLIVRESQAAVFFYKGKAVGAFGPGRHTLKTANIPILTKIASLPWAMESPLKAEVFFANLKTFTNLKWGTRDPVAFKDKDLGLVRLRAFGVFNLKIVQPVLFINTLAGTQGIYTSADISDYLNQVVVSRFNDYIGEKVSSIFDLPEQYDELGKGLAQRLRKDFSAFGLNLTHLYINAITPPPEVQQAIDDKSRLGLFDDMNRLMQMKTAMAMEKIADNPQGIASDGAQAGLGLGLGMMLPGIFSQQMHSPPGQPADQTVQTTACPECQSQIPLNAKFCSQCGHQQVIFAQCRYCGKNITPGTKFCPRCGKQVVEKTKEKICGNCGAKNLPDSIFCNQCGEKY